jgi:hypothetical protein
VQGYEVSTIDDVDPLTSGPTDETSPRSSLVTFTRGADRRTLLLVEAVWSDCFHPASFRRCAWWAVRSLPAVVLLLSPDQRDAESFKAAASSASPWTPTEIARGVGRALRPGSFLSEDDFVLFRLFSRLLVAFLLVGVLVAGVIAQPAVGLVLAFAVVAYVLSRRHLVGHVVVAASDDMELGNIQDRVQHCLGWARERSARVVAVGHSQGGFLAHAVLSNAGMRSPQSVGSSAWVPASNRSGSCASSTNAPCCWRPGFLCSAS